ncbi:MAG: hypothetical protein ACPGTP_03285 [Bacteroidia bacterium]
MNLAKEISFLLYKHSCVVLPGFGAFVVNDKEAERNEVANYALPKRQVLTFNGQIQNNDGLLANHVSSVNSCTYELGLTKVNQYISGLWDLLRSQRNAEIDEVGTFYYTQEDKLIFVPQLASNFSQESFGLPKLRLIKPQNVIQPQSTVDSTPSQKIDPIVKEESKKVEEIDTPVLVQKRNENQRRFEELQQRRLDKKTETPTGRQKKYNGLWVVNTLGILFLVSMAIALFNFENNAQFDLGHDKQIASVLDTPSSAPTDIPGEAINEIEETLPIVSEIPQYAIYAESNSEVEASQLLNSLIGKYKHATAGVNTDGGHEVFIISFSNEELAIEYKKLIQNKIDQNLVIKQK